MNEVYVTNIIKFCNAGCLLIPHFLFCFKWPTIHHHQHSHSSPLDFTLIIIYISKLKTINKHSIELDGYSMGGIICGLMGSIANQLKCCKDNFFLGNVICNWNFLLLMVMLRNLFSFESIFWVFNLKMNRDDIIQLTLHSCLWHSRFSNITKFLPKRHWDIT